MIILRCWPLIAIQIVLFWCMYDYHIILFCNYVNSTQIKNHPFGIIIDKIMHCNNYMLFIKKGDAIPPFREIMYFIVLSFSGCRNNE